MPTFLNKKIKSSELGFAAFFVTILVLVVMTSIAISITALTIGEQKISKDITRTNQAYYAAEAGVEDALLRLTKGKKKSSPYTLSVGSASVTTTISEEMGGTATITSEGSIANRIRKLQIECVISTDKIGFYYGAQIGEGGMIMGNGSRIMGNVFSNGNVVNNNPTLGKGIIDNSITVAHNGNKIRGLLVGDNATVHTCEGSEIGDTLTYVSGGSAGDCTAGVLIKSQPNEIEHEYLRLDPANPENPNPNQIEDWKTEAAVSGVNTDHVTIGSGTNFLGPIQIGTEDQPRNLTISNDFKKDNFYLTGTVYVTGNIILNGNSTMKLDSSYGCSSGVIIAGGTVLVENGTVLDGSGQLYEGNKCSFLLVLSDKYDHSNANPVINVRNNASGAIFYANDGWIYFKNGAQASEITGYGIEIENGAIVQYEFGLQNASFTSGPGGGWQVASWKEIQ